MMLFDSSEVDERLSLFGEVLAQMLGRPEFLYPFVAAQEQYRKRYYGLASAAMLEDLFYDALSSFIRNHKPSLRLRRQTTGNSGTDYCFEGLEVSHKVSKSGAESIAALWDATREVETWTFDSPICFVSSRYSRTRISASRGTSRLSLRQLLQGAEIGDGDAVILVRWSELGTAVTIEQIFDAASGPVDEVLPFNQVWRLLSNIDGADRGSNAFELFATRRSNLRDLSVGMEVEIDRGILRPGAYLFDRSWLSNLAVTRNNRAVLVPKQTVAELMDRASACGTFTPLSTWFGIFGGLEPPDLYLTQRTSFDRLFSGQM